MTLQYRYGQKALVDVLNASQDVLDAGSNLITANRERIVASFALLRATGQLTLDTIGPDLADAPAVLVGRFPEALDRKGPLDIGLKRTSDLPEASCWLECPASLDHLALRVDTESGNIRRPLPAPALTKLPDLALFKLRH